ncbi:MAG: hypothetical protein ABGX16_13325 [Pirellulales bacterium]
MIDFAGPLDGGTIFLDDLLGEMEIFGDLVIDASTLPNRLTVNAGHGADNTPGTGDGMRIFRIDDGDELIDSSVEIHGLTLIGGDVSGDGGAILSAETLQLVDSTITGNATGDGASGGSYGESSGFGGGIYSYGALTITDSVISGNSTGDGGNTTGVGYGYSAGSSGSGGGIYSYGSLSVTDSVISGNSTGAGGYGGYGSGSSGGGIYSDGTLTISNSTITGNSADEGGGIYSYGVTNITDSMISGNNAYDGGGVTSGGTTTIISSTISENTGVFGAGLSAFGTNTGTTTISDSTISGNAGEVGGGIAVYGMTVIRSSTISQNTALFAGGGIFSSSNLDYGTSLTLTNSTVSGNTTGDGKSDDGYGGGLYNAGGLALILHSTITGNTAPDGHGSGVSSYGDAYEFTPTRTEVRSSIIAGNTNSDVDVNSGPTNSFVSQGVPPTIDIGAFELDSLASSADFDGDGAIDGYDFLTWQRGFGIPVPDATQSDGDANHDQTVDGADLTVWQDQFGLATLLPVAISSEETGSLKATGTELGDSMVGLSGVIALATQTSESVQLLDPSPPAKVADLDYQIVHRRAFAQWPDTFPSERHSADLFDLELNSSAEATGESQSLADDSPLPGDEVFTHIGTL